MLAICVGLFQGGIQALSRSEFGKLIPKEHANEYYGFFDIFGKYAAVMGTFLVSFFTQLSGQLVVGRAVHRRAVRAGLRAAVEDA